MSAGAGFGAFVAAAQETGHLVVQPRMGMSSPDEMRAGLVAVKRATPATVGTITLDSYTRGNNHAAAYSAVSAGERLNGYPIVAHGPRTTAAVLDGVLSPAFPVQVRHGSPDPRQIFAAMLKVGLSASEGGPVSYCLPYGRRPLRESVDAWGAACDFLAEARSATDGVEPHLETFGGCMLGQLCPPSLLIALSVLEALFFRQHGLHSLSLSYAQQTDPDQDLEALAALSRLAGDLLAGLDWHIVVYAYMGVYPKTAQGALLLLGEAAKLAVYGGAARLIVKTRAEAHQIPTVAENIEALEHAGAVARQTVATRSGAPAPSGAVTDTELYDEARLIVEAVLGLHSDVGQALLDAFQTGLLDVPFCLHPDNHGRTRAFIDGTGRLHWSDTGALPIRRSTVGGSRMSSRALLAALGHVAAKFDAVAATPGPGHGGHTLPTPFVASC
jgi:methylaspartate mutase epsilon subunit